MTKQKFFGIQKYIFSLVLALGLTLSPSANAWALSFTGMEKSSSGAVFFSRGVYEEERDSLFFLLAVPDIANFSVSITGNDYYSLSDNMPEYLHIAAAGSLRSVAIIKVGVRFDETFPLTDTIKVHLNYGVILPKPEKKHSSAELFAGMLNYRDASAILAASGAMAAPRKKVHSQGSAADIPTLKLLTKSDNIAFAVGSDILADEPEFGGRGREHLRLYLDGREVPLYNTGGNTGLFSPSDTLYFLGSRARSTDTLDYLNQYSLETPFFLKWQPEGGTPQRYRRIDMPDRRGAAVEKIAVSLHREEDRVYHLGDIPVGARDEQTIHRSERVAGEGWYWQQFSFQREIAQLEPIFPIEGEEMTLNIKYKGLTDNRFFDPDHAIRFLLNDSLYEERIFNGTQEGIVEIKASGEALVGGLNRIALFAPGAPGHDIPNPNGNYTEENALDCYTVSGMVRPLVSGGILEGSGQQVGEGDYLRVRGLGAPAAVAIDSLHRTIKMSRSTDEGVVLFASYYRRGGIGAGVSIGIGDVRFFSREQQSFLMLRRGVSEPAELFSLETQAAAAATALAAAPAGSIAIIVRNGGTTPAATVMNALRDYGAEQATPSRFLFIGEKGKGRIAFNAAPTTASEALFYEQQGAGQFVHDIPLAHQRSWHLRAAGSDAIERATTRTVEKDDILEQGAGAEYIAIAHRDFIEVAQKFAEYRQITHGYATAVVDVESIYDRFSHGRKDPRSIREYLRRAVNDWEAQPVYLNLVGDACWDMRGVAPETIKKDFVPSFGRPVSDYWYTLVGEDTTSFYPELIVGRVSIETPEQGEAILAKIKEHETAPDASWMKRFLFLAGGQNDAERAGFRSDNIVVAMTMLEVPPLCADIDTVFKNESTPTSSNQATEIRRAINRGAAWVNYVGHGSPTVFDMDFGNAGDLNNRGRYPLLATFSCQTAAFAEPNVTAKNEDFVREAERGFVGAFGTSGFGSINEDRLLLRAMMNALALDSVRTMASILSAAKVRRIEASPIFLPPVIENTVMQYSFLGDPLTQFSLDNIPDLFIVPGEVQYVGSEPSSPVRSTDSIVTLTIPLRNRGTNVWQNIPLLVVREHAGRADTARVEQFRLCQDVELSVSFPVADKEGQHIFTFLIDPEQTLEAERTHNNVVRDTLFVFSPGLLALDPQPYWNVEPVNPRIRVVRQEEREGEEVEFRLYARDGRLLTIGEEDDIDFGGGYVDWTPTITLDEGRQYYIEARLLRPGEDRVTAVPLSVPFTATSIESNEEVEWKISSSEDVAAFADYTLETPIGDQGLLELRDRKMPFLLASDGSGSSEVSLVRFELDGEEYINTRFARGVNIWLIPPAANSPRTSIYRDTYFVPFDTAANSGNARDIVNFLRDSVQSDDYVVLATCNEALTQFTRGDRNIGEFRAVLRSLGAVYGDSLDFESSYILISKGGEALFEEWRPFTAAERRITVLDSLTLFRPTGNATTTLIGPAVGWNEATVRVWGSEGAAVRVQVIAADGDTLIDRKQQVAGERDIRLSFSQEAVNVQHISLRIEGERATIEDTFLLEAVELRYIPAAELYIGSELPSQEVLRADTVETNIVVRNIALRGVRTDIPLLLQVQPASGQVGTSITREENIPAIEPDGSGAAAFTFTTEQFANLSRVRALLNSKGEVPEYYTFNNTATGEIRLTEDEIPPVIEVFADGQIINDGSIISRRPQLEIVITDNSLLPMTSRNAARFILNGRIYPHPVFGEYEYREVNIGNEKIRITSTPELDLGDNFFRIEATDATGNRTLKEMIVRTVSSPRIEEARAVPTPFRDEVRFECVFADELNAERVHISIVDRLGRVVKRWEQGFVVGRNTFTWDGKDEFGARLSVGTYYARIIVEGSFGVQIKQTIPCLLAQ